MFWAKFLVFIKKYWQLLALVVASVVAIIVFKQQDSSFVERLKSIQDSHDIALKKINDAREEEKKQQAINQQKLQDTLELVQKQYDDALVELNAKKKKEIKEIVSQYGDDPVELAKQLSAATGFSILL